MRKEGYIDIFFKEILEIWTANKEVSVREFEARLQQIFFGILDLRFNVRQSLNVSSALYITTADIFFQKIFDRFSENYKTKEEALKAAENLYEEITAPWKLKIAIVVDKLMVNLLKEFCHKQSNIGSTIGSIDVEINSILLLENIKIPKGLEELLQEKGVTIAERWDDFAEESKKSYLAIMGGRYLLPTEEEFKKRIFWLIKQGVTVSTFESVQFITEDALSALKEAIILSPFKNGEIIFRNGRIQLRKDFKANAKPQKPKPVIPLSFVPFPAFAG